MLTLFDWQNILRKHSIGVCVLTKGVEAILWLELALQIMLQSGLGGT